MPSWQPSLIFFNIPIESGSIIKPCTLKHFQVTYRLHKAGYWTTGLFPPDFLMISSTHYFESLLVDYYIWHDACGTNAILVQIYTYSFFYHFASQICCWWLKSFVEKRKKAGFQQPWCWPFLPGMFHPQHQKGWFVLVPSVPLFKDDGRDIITLHGKPQNVLEHLLYLMLSVVCTTVYVNSEHFQHFKILISMYMCTIYVFACFITHKLDPRDQYFLYNPRLIFRSYPSFRLIRSDQNAMVYINVNPMSTKYKLNIELRCPPNSLNIVSSLC